MIRVTTNAARIALTAMLLSGCAVGPNYHHPEIVAPVAFTEPQPTSGAAVDPATWWTVFGDRTLNSLVDRALAGGPDIAVAASRIRAARLGEITARAQGLPTVNASGEFSDVKFSKNAGFATLARQFSSGGGGGASGSSGSGSGAGAGAGSGSPSANGIALPGDSISTWAIGFDASWELDIFGGVRRGVEAARARTEAAVWNGRDAAVSLSAEVAQAYFALRLDQLQASVIDEEVQRQQRVLQIAFNQAKVGLVPETDITRQRAQLTATQARLEPIRSDVRVRIHALGVLLGTSPETLEPMLLAPAPLLGPAPVVPAGLPSDLLRRRPDVRAAERNLAAATADIGVAVADLYPKFNLTGMAQLISTTLRTLFEGDSVQLTGVANTTFPILDWGRRRATVGMRREEREQAYQQYRATVLGALRDVEDPLAQIDAERRRNAALRTSVADQAAAAKAAAAQYQTGLAAQDTPLNADADLLNAREQLAQSDAQLRQYTVSLFKGLGGGWRENMPAPNRADYSRCCETQVGAASPSVPR